jgi:hypothetical protein
MGAFASEMRMKISRSRILTLALALVCAGTAAWQVDAEQNDVTFPPIAELTHYTTVERGSTVEHMLTTPEALASLKAGEQVPTGTHLVLQDFQNGELFRFLVSQKLGDGPSDWGYQWFWPDGTIKEDERTDQCFSCHRSREAQQFMFTHDGAMNFGG